VYRLSRPSDADLDMVAGRLLEHTEPTATGRHGLRHDRWQQPLPPAVGLTPLRRALQEWRSQRGACAGVRPGLAPHEGDDRRRRAAGGTAVGCRALSGHPVFDEPDRYGFTYATFPATRSGARESFLLTTTKASWRSRSKRGAGRPTSSPPLGGPVSRYLQHRAVQRYLTLDRLGRLAGPWRRPRRRRRWAHTSWLSNSSLRTSA